MNRFQFGLNWQYHAESNQSRSIQIPRKSCDRSRRVNIFIGANGSGKSNLLRPSGAWRCCQRSVDDEPLAARRPAWPSVLYKSSSKAAGSQGDSFHCFQVGASFSVDFSIRWTNRSLLGDSRRKN